MKANAPRPPRAGGARRATRDRRAPLTDSLGRERLVFFSDAVFAIAITLLVIEIRLPEADIGGDGGKLLAALGALLPRYVSFVVSFIVIGNLWLGHHRMFRMVRAYDGPLMLLNLLFLFFVASLPFPTAVVGRYSAIPAAEALYAGWVALAGFAKLAMWMYASRRGRLLSPEVKPDEAALDTLRSAIPAVVFLVSIPFAWLHTLGPIVAWNLAPLSYVAVRVIFRRRRRAKVR